jgi:hypothetical protein
MKEWCWCKEKRDCLKTWLTKDKCLKMWWYLKWRIENPYNLGQIRKKKRIKVVFIIQEHSIEWRLFDFCLKIDVNYLRRYRNCQYI